jgi:hypothetical protein
MKDITFIIHCWLNVENTILGVSRQDFTKKVRSPEWTKKRLGLFNKFTLPSLYNQEFQDFRIFLFCNPRYKNITDGFEFDDPDNKVELIYDCGKSIYENEIETPYVNITRIDSDDMFRFDVMNLVKENVRKTNKREAYVFRRLWQWNIVNKFMSHITIIRSPFTSHTFPKAIYKDWKCLSKEQFMDYRSGKREGPTHKVCIIRHNNNVTWTRLNWDITRKWYKRREQQRRKNFITDKNKMRKILKDFGIKPEMVK